jgi:hypothetical protein
MGRRVSDPCGTGDPPVILPAKDTAASPARRQSISARFRAAAVDSFPVAN